VTGCGGPVDGRVCLLYLSGQGALVFTDVSTGQERRVEIMPNRAVSWPNAQHTHRVEAALGHADEPRLMIGPHFSDTSAGGKLVRCGCAAFFPRIPDFSNTDLLLIGAVFVVGTPIAAAGAVAGGVVAATLAVPTAVVYYTHKAAADGIADIAGTAKLGSQVRKGKSDAGYRFGDLTRGVLAKGAGKRAGDTAADYAFGDFVSGMFTSAEDPAVQAANQVTLVNAGRQLMMQHRLAIAKLTHSRLSSESFVADLDLEVLHQVIAHLGYQMLQDASDDAKVETLLRTNSRLAVYGTLVSDDRYAQPGGPSIGDPFAVLDDAGGIFLVGLLDSYDSEKHLYCIVTKDGTGRSLMGFPPDRVRSLKALIGSYVQIGPTARTWVDPGIPAPELIAPNVIRSTLFKPGSIWDTYTALNPTLPSEHGAQARLRSMSSDEKRHAVTYHDYFNLTWNERLAVAMHASSGESGPISSADPLSVPVGAVARVTKISDTIQHTVLYPHSNSPQYECKTGVLYATVVVGLQSDIAEAGELGDDGPLGVLMDGPPDEELLHGPSKLDVRARFIECVLPLHCLQPIAVEGGVAGGGSVEEGVPPTAGA
jgi:hypothetical protein